MESSSLAWVTRRHVERLDPDRRPGAETLLAAAEGAASPFTKENGKIEAEVIADERRLFRRERTTLGDAV